MDTIITTSLNGALKAKENFSKAAHNISRSNLNIDNSYNSSSNNSQKQQPVSTQPNSSQAHNHDHNISLAGEIVSMIQSSRNYEANLKVISTWSDTIKDSMDMLDSKK